MSAENKERAQNYQLSIVRGGAGGVGGRGPKSEHPVQNCLEHFPCLGGVCNPVQKVVDPQNSAVTYPDFSEVNRNDKIYFELLLSWERKHSSMQTAVVYLVQFCVLEVGKKLDQHVTVQKVYCEGGGPIFCTTRAVLFPPLLGFNTLSTLTRKLSSFQVYCEGGVCGSFIMPVGRGLVATISALVGDVVGLLNAVLIDFTGKHLLGRVWVLVKTVLVLIKRLLWDVVVRQGRWMSDTFFPKNFRSCLLSGRVYCRTTEAVILQDNRSSLYYIRD